MRSLVSWLVAGALLGGGLGVLIGELLGAPAGAQHHCPALAPASACAYPPDVARWLWTWAVAGALGAALVALAARRLLSNRRTALSLPDA